MAPRCPCSSDDSVTRRLGRIDKEVPDAIWQTVGRPASPGGAAGLGQPAAGFEPRVAPAAPVEASIRRSSVGEKTRPRGSGTPEVTGAALRAAPSRAEAARALGISPRTLRYKLARFKEMGHSISAERG